MTVKQKSLSLAVLSALAGTAQAAIPTADGVGSVLQYSYYTVNGGNDTLMSVVNSTSSAKAVKVRFYDSKNTREVLDFNLFLSPYDVWTAALSKNSNGGATLKTNDKSCTVPTIPAAGVDFRNTRFDETQGGNIIDNSLARTSEGHFEVIEMGDIVNASVAEGVTHNAGVPVACARATAMYTNSQTLSASGTTAVGAPSGGLFGSASVINVAGGTDIGYDPDVWTNVHAAGNHTAPGLVLPNIASGSRDSQFFHNGVVFGSRFADGGDSISSTITRSALMSEWIVDAAINAGTDLVINFPTKWFYTGACGTLARAPFTNQGFCRIGAPEAISVSMYDREERTSVQNIDFSPLPPSGITALPWETNVVTIKNSNVLSSPNSFNLNPPVGNEGWLRIDFTGTYNTVPRVVTGVAGTGTVNGAACGGTNTLRAEGLPVNGFSVQRYVNSNVGGVLSNYAGNFNHKYERRVTCN